MATPFEPQTTVLMVEWPAPLPRGAASRPGVRFGPCFDGGKKCATRLANCFQLGVPLRRLSDASPSRFNLLNNHHNLGRLPARTGILHPRLLGQAWFGPSRPIWTNRPEKTLAV